jgi:hypothetical protein
MFKNDGVPPARESGPHPHTRTVRVHAHNLLVQALRQRLVA